MPAYLSLHRVNEQIDLQMVMILDDDKCESFFFALSLSFCHAYVRVSVYVCKYGYYIAMILNVCPFIEMI